MQAYERDVKNLILHNKHVFAKGSKHQVAVFEKRITQKTRADCLIFSHERGLIGIEIKTDRDSTKRLPHQLRDYLQVCNYVYVFIHDDMLQDVSDTLMKLSQEGIDSGRVGIVLYSEFQGKLIIGTLQEATLQRVNPRNLVKLLWSSECRVIAYQVARDRKQILRVRSKPAMISYVQHGDSFITKLIDMYINRSFDKEHKISTYRLIDDKKE